jgi:hypothetical protein
VAQPLKKAESKEKNVQKGLDNSGNIEGNSVRPGKAGQRGLEVAMPS